jgi:hypothetical protein
MKLSSILPLLYLVTAITILGTLILSSPIYYRNLNKPLEFQGDQPFLDVVERQDDTDQITFDEPLDLTERYIIPDDTNLGFGGRDEEPVTSEQDVNDVQVALPTDAATDPTSPEIIQESIDTEAEKNEIFQRDTEGDEDEDEDEDEDDELTGGEDVSERDDESGDDYEEFDERQV